MSLSQKYNIIMNKRFLHIFRHEAKVFYDSFTHFSKELFSNENGGVYIHSGEFGRYRERAVERFLRLITPQNLKFGDGFILTPRNQVSTQCDIIIYSQEDTPLISDNNATFFPIESVAGVVEVKSKLSKSELKNTLRKLANVKKLREDIYNDTDNELEISRKNNLSAPKKDVLWNHQDTLFTVLICEKFDFNLKASKPSEFYDNSIPPRYWHNLVLSLDDGVLVYNYERDHCWPVLAKGSLLIPSNQICYPKEDAAIPYLEIFGHLYNLGISVTSLFYPELRNYFDERFTTDSPNQLIIPGKWPA